MTLLTAPAGSSSPVVDESVASAPRASGAEAADCAHDWSDTYPWRDCWLCGAGEETPEVPVWAEGTE